MSYFFGLNLEAGIVGAQNFWIIWWECKAMEQCIPTHKYEHFLYEEVIILNCSLAWKSFNLFIFEFSSFKDIHYFRFDFQMKPTATQYNVAIRKYASTICRRINRVVSHAALNVPGNDDRRWVMFIRSCNISKFEIILCSKMRAGSFETLI